MADSSNNPNSSTLKSYVDSAIGTAQSALGNLTGSTGDQAQGETRQTKAQAEHDASHTVGKVGPYAVSGSGGVSKDSADRSEGSWNQTIGSAKESLGNLTGVDSLKKDGQQQNAAGKEQEARGQLNDLGQGVADRFQGAAGAAVAGITGDREGQQKFMDLHDDGKTAQRSAERDIQKNA